MDLFEKFVAISKKILGNFYAVIWLFQLNNWASQS